MPNHYPLSLQEVNSLNQDDFVFLFSNVYEHSPWAAKKAYSEAPFASIEALLKSFRQHVDAAPQTTRMALLNAHPELGERHLESLTEHSRNEQQGSGLTTADNNVKEQFRTLNSRYRKKHFFPFIIAVAGLKADAILNALQSRLDNDTESEFITALQQVHRIAQLRIEQIIVDK